MTGGKQQVLPLDSIFKKTLPEWNKYVQQLCTVYIYMSVMSVWTAVCCQWRALIHAAVVCFFLRPLPHERIRQGWRPSGDPVYARTCLVFPKHEQHCRVGKFVPLPTCTVTALGEQLACNCCACADV